MSKITIANRQFLEEQVKLTLKEEISTFTADINPNSLSAQAEVGIDDIVSFVEATLNDVMALPNEMARSLDRNLLRGGSRSRQALIKSGAPFDVKTFFATYKLDRSSKITPMDLSSESFQLPTGLRTILRDSSNKEPKDVYEELLKFYSSGFISRYFTAQVSEFVLVSQDSADQIIESCKDKQIPNQVTIKLLFRRAFIKQARKDRFLNDIANPSVDALGFLKQDKQILLNELKADHESDLGAFFLYSQIDPTLTKSLESWKSTYSDFMAIFKEFEKQSKGGIEKFNWTSLLLLIMAGEALDKRLFKLASKSKKIAQWTGRGGLIGFIAGVVYVMVVAETLNYSLDQLDLKGLPMRVGHAPIPGTSAADLKTMLDVFDSAERKVDSFIPGAKKRKIKQNLQEWELSLEEVDEVKNIFLEIVNVQMENFQKAANKSLLSQTASESGATLLVFYEQMNQLKQSLFENTFYIRESNYEDFKKNIKKAKKDSNKLYMDFRRPVQAFEEQNALLETPSKPVYDKPTGFIDQTVDATLDKLGTRKKKQKFYPTGRKINNIMITDKELKVSGLNEKFITQLTDWYALGAPGEQLSIVGRFDPILEEAGKIDDFVVDSINQNINKMSNLSRAFAKAWDTYVSPVSSRITGKKSTIFTRDYSGIGLMLQMRGRNGLFSYRENKTLIAAPLLWNLEANSAFTIAPSNLISGQFKDLINRSVALNQGSTFGFYSEILKSNPSYINLMKTLGPTESALNKLDASSVKGNLNVILKINYLVTKLLGALEAKLIKEELKAKTSFDAADASQTAKTTAEQALKALEKTISDVKPYLVMCMVYSDLEVFFQKNKFQFVDDVRRNKN